jgi:hypothetical protein
MIKLKGVPEQAFPFQISAFCQIPKNAHIIFASPGFTVGDIWFKTENSHVTQASYDEDWNGDRRKGVYCLWSLNKQFMRDNFTMLVQQTKEFQATKGEPWFDAEVQRLESF